MTITKTLIAAAALTAAFSAQAADSRQQFVAGNPDSDAGGMPYHGAQAVQPSIDAGLSRYQGIDNGNRDLFGVSLGGSADHQRPNIYGPFGASPDLTF